MVHALPKECLRTVLDIITDLPKDDLYKTQKDCLCEANPAYSTLRKIEAKRILFIPQIRKIEAEGTLFIPQIGKIEVKSVYSTNTKDRSGANSASSRNRQDRREKNELDRSKTNRAQESIPRN